MFCATRRGRKGAVEPRRGKRRHSLRVWKQRNPRETRFLLSSEGQQRRSVRTDYRQCGSANSTMAKIDVK